LVKPTLHVTLRRMLEERMSRSLSSRLCLYCIIIFHFFAA